MSTTSRTTLRRASLLAIGALTGATLVSIPALAGPALASPALASPAGSSTARASGPVPATEITYAGEGGGSFGAAVGRTSCDVNGDGRDDVIVGDWGWNRPNYAKTGAGYVLLGGDAPAGGDVADFDAARTVRIDGPSVTITAGAWVGWSASCLGDVNGDGIEDFALGSGSRTYHSVHVILGDRELQNIDLDFLGTEGFVIDDPRANDKLDAEGGTVLDGATDNFGVAVGAVGDLDGDGLDDIGIVDQLFDRPGLTNSGRVWVVAGSRSVRDVDVSTDAERVLFTVDGAAADDRLGTVAAGGDVNGDGVDDFVMSSYTATPWGAAAPVAGAAYVVFGGAGTASHVDLAHLGDDGFTIRGPVRGRDRLGISIAPAGDVNGDGSADVVVGADGVSRPDAPRAGGAAVVFGSASTATVLTDPAASGPTVLTCTDAAIDPSCGSPTRRGYWIDGEADGGKAGFSVGSVADIDGDDAPEILVGAQSGSRGTWLVRGSATADRIGLSTLAADAGQRLGVGRSASIGSAGDLDGNGVDDVVAGGGNAVSVYLLGALATTTEITGPDRGTVGDTLDYSAVVRSSVRSRSGDLTGSVTFSLDGEEVTGCAELPVEDTTAVTCALPVASPAGARKVAVTYTPTHDAFAASTASTDLQVARASGPVPALVLSTTGVGYGGPAAVATVTVDHLLTGDVEVLVDGRSAGRVMPHHGSATLALPRRLAVGRHQVTARYLGDVDREPGAASAASTLTVRKAVTLSAPRVSARPGRAVVRVVLGRLDNGDFAAGPVRVQVGRVTRTVPVSATDQGATDIRLPRRLARGSILRVRYLGNATTAASRVVRLRVR